MSKTSVMPVETEEARPDSCEGCNSDDFGYRPEMGVWACEACHENAVMAYMSVFA